MATFPAFLIGDQIVSWLEVLRLNRNNEELIDHGALLFPEEFRKLIHFMPMGAIYTLLKEFERTRKLGDSKTNARLAPSSSSVSTASC